MERRAVLGGVAGLLAGSAGCLEAVGLGGSMFQLRAMRATEASIEATDVTCELPESMLDAHPKLRDVLREASETPRGEWASIPVSEETGTAVGDALVANCEQTGGLNRYEDEWYFISVRFRDGSDAADHHDDGHSH